MKLLRYGVVVCLGLLLLGCTLRSPTVSPTSSPVSPVLPPPTVQPAAGMANPASVFCGDQGGKLEIRHTAEGDTGYCLFPDGSECEEWAFYRGECKPGGVVTPAAVVTPPAIPTDDLLAQVQAALPAGAFKGFQVLPLTAPAGSRPLWAVFSTGLRNFELEPLPNHFLAIYTHGDAGWQELGRVNLDEEVSDNMAWPDYLDPAGVTQVSVEPTRVWLAVEGGAGAHGGTYHLLSFDGTTLRREISAAAASPGVGTAQDLNGDGLVDIVLNQSDAYVFCYACGVRKIMFQVYTWDASNQRIREVTLQPFLMGQPQPLRDWVNPAVDLANAGLWKDALSAITQAQELVSQYPEADVQTLTWDYALIKLHAEALAQALTDSPYPLLANVFYGDDAAAVELMRAYSPDQLFTPQTPLIVGTVAEQWVSEVSSRITEATTAALAVKPDLAAAYFLRGWAAYLADPTSPQARADVRRAAELAPGDTLFVSSAAYLQ